MTEQSKKDTKFAAILLAGGVLAFGLVQSAMNQASQAQPALAADELGQVTTVRGTRADYQDPSLQKGDLYDIGSRRGTRIALAEIDSHLLDPPTVMVAPRRGTR